MVCFADRFGAVSENPQQDKDGCGDQCVYIQILPHCGCNGVNGQAHAATEGSDAKAQPQSAQYLCPTADRMFDPVFYRFFVYGYSTIYSVLTI